MATLLKPQLFFRCISFSIILAMAACTNPAKKESTASTDSLQMAAPQDLTAVNDTPKTVGDSAVAKLVVKTFANDVSIGGYGFDLEMNGKTYIHQPTIPAVQGNHGFSSESNARKAGDLMAGKIRHNIMPPGVTEHELDSIGALK